MITVATKNNNNNNNNCDVSPNGVKKTEVKHTKRTTYKHS